MGARPIDVAQTPRLAWLALACLATPEPPAADDAAEAQWLADLRATHADAVLQAPAVLAAWRAAPPPADAALAQLVRELRLGTPEVLALALALAADTDVMAGRALAWLQAPLHTAWPTVGLVGCLAGMLGLEPQAALAQLLDGAALATGLLRLDTRDRALPDATLAIPTPLVLAATLGRGRWPGVDEATCTVALPPSLLQAVQAQARALGAGGCLVVASGHPQEARGAAAALAQALGRTPVFVHGEAPAGLGPWLLLRNAVPVFCGVVAPGERRRLQRPPGHSGALLVAGGPDGSWEFDGVTVPAWRVPVPPRDERAALWCQHGLPAPAAAALARRHRHAGTRIHALAEGAHAQRRAEGAAELSAHHVVSAARDAHATDLGALAEALCDAVPDDALVLPPALRLDLDALVQRCEARDGLADTLGPAARTRYRAGVRALFVGASGTGKTLSASWLATRLGMPLYRVDLAAVSSKYIGETEKNLGELFARAEHAEVILLFDEADAMFGKRTEVKDANDRYANQQTNYLLQRIETFEGIVLLTSNSRSRFDSAFTRRLDSILEFPAPAADERRALWLAHLGKHHTLGGGDLNRLAAGCDFAGGHIRNVVLGARARVGDAPIDGGALSQALGTEYRKLGKSMPATLAAAR
jgi:hypothetical protein